MRGSVFACTGDGRTTWYAAETRFVQIYAKLSVLLKICVPFRGSSRGYPCWSRNPAIHCSKDLVYVKTVTVKTAVRGSGWKSSDDSEQRQSALSKGRHQRALIQLYEVTEAWEIDAWLFFHVSIAWHLPLDHLQDTGRLLQTVARSLWHGRIERDLRGKRAVWMKTKFGSAWHRSKNNELCCFVTLRIHEQYCAAIQPPLHQIY